MFVSDNDVDDKRHGVLFVFTHSKHVYICMSMYLCTLWWIYREYCNSNTVANIWSTQSIYLLSDNHTEVLLHGKMYWLVMNTVALLRNDHIFLINTVTITTYETPVCMLHLPQHNWCSTSYLPYRCMDCHTCVQYALPELWKWKIIVSSRQLHICCSFIDITVLFSQVIGGIFQVSHVCILL